MAKKLTEKALIKNMNTMSREELIKINSDLFKTNKSVEARLNLMLIGDEYGSSLLEKYKKQLYKIFNPSNIVRTGFSLERVQIYHDAISVVSEDEELYKQWKDRLEYIYQEFSGFGWGMDDYITGEYYSIPWLEEN